MSDDGVQFLDADEDSSNDGQEQLPGPGRRPRTSRLVVGIVGVVTMIVIAYLLVDTPKDGTTPDAARSQATTGAQSPPPGSSSVPAPTTPPRPPIGAYPTTVLHNVGIRICGRIPACTITRGRPELLRAARLALGRVKDLQTRVAGQGRGTFTAALMPDGAQLLAVVVAPGISITPAALQIAPPIGVQSQPNGADRLTVVVSGAPDAVALLSRRKVQSWLATLRAKPPS